MPHRVVLGACLCAWAMNATAADNWPRFRGSNGNGVATGAAHPEAWSADEHLAWKVKLPGVGWSQPIVWGDKIFLTTAVSEKGQRPKPGDWSPGEGGVMTLVFGNYRKPPAVEYQWK